MNATLRLGAISILAAATALGTAAVYAGEDGTHDHQGQTHDAGHANDHAADHANDHGAAHHEGHDKGHHKGHADDHDKG